jgi:hypothetical protein
MRGLLFLLALGVTAADGALIMSTKVLASLMPHEVMVLSSCKDLP